MESKSIDALREEVQTLIRLKRPLEAVVRCNDALSAFEFAQHSRIVGFRAQAEWSAGNREDALRDIAIARDMDQTWPAHLYQLALWLLELERFDEAPHAADQLIRLEQERASTAFIDAARFLKAYGLVFNGRRPEGLQALALVSDESPTWIAGRLISKSDLMDMCNDGAK
jgi:tetratricopeptide (TPR) repeat protein